MTDVSPPKSLALRSKLVAQVLAASSLVLIAMGSTSCKDRITNDMHCFYNGGNAACEQRYDGDLPYCGTVCLDRDGNPPSPNGDGCVDFQPDVGCYSPCGDVDVAEDDTCLIAGTGTESTTEPSQTSSNSSTGPTTADSSGTETTSPTSMTADTGPTGCEGDDDCTDPFFPLCDDEQCRSCQAVGSGDGLCAIKTPETPACGEAGNCVECTATSFLACGDTQPVCDAVAEECRACIAHDECPDSACGFATGECFRADCVIRVPDDEDTIGEAVATIPVNGGCTILLEEVDASDYEESITIGNGRRVALLNEGVSEIVIQGAAAPTFTVSGGSALYLDRVRVSGGGAQGINVSGDGSLLYLERTQVVDNNGGGVTVVLGGYARARNSTLAGANGMSPAFAVLSGSADIIASTLVGAGINGIALECEAGGSATLRSSVVFAEDDAAEVSCGDLDASYNAAEQDLGAAQGNAAVGLATSSFANFSNGDLHLSPAGANLVDDIAQWLAGDPLEDLDGDARVAADGSMEHAGADIP